MAEDSLDAAIAARADSGRADDTKGKYATLGKKLAKAQKKLAKAEKKLAKGAHHKAFAEFKKAWRDARRVLARFTLTLG